MPLLTAKENLDFYLGMREQWLDTNKTFMEVFKRHFKSHRPMYKMSFSNMQFLRSFIEVCSGNRHLLVLDEPTLGLDLEQRTSICQLISRLRQHRAILINT